VPSFVLELNGSESLPSSHEALLLDFILLVHFAAAGWFHIESSIITFHIEESSLEGFRHQHGGGGDAKLIFMAQVKHITSYTPLQQLYPVNHQHRHPQRRRCSRNRLVTSMSITDTMMAL
jgi:hypothetical protein